ncbi:MAG: exodeoxyribonuclease V subunit beta [Terrimicrobiaceae bacterium]
MKRPSISAFELASTPLEPGVTLIEASAGTGKTFTIAGLVLRMLLELHIPIEKILVVTYTVAATAELRDRIRRRIREALDDLLSGSATEEIISRYLAEGNVSLGIRELEAALSSFDEARIFTINGFCQRVLRDHAFETGVPMEMELLADPEPLYSELIRDFWRKHIGAATPLIAALAGIRGISPSGWDDLLKSTRNHPDLRIIPDPEEETLANLSARLENHFQNACSAWPAASARVENTLRESKGLSRSAGRYKWETDCAEILSSLNSPGASLTARLGAFLKLSSSAIQEGTKPSGSPPTDEFFNLCQHLQDSADRFLARLQRDLIDFVDAGLPVKKLASGVMTYRDQLTLVRDVLAGSHGERLATLLKEQYSAALIDEFQDTDPVQYGIFSRLFAGGNHHLYLIGDPKQAIYGFRGADIFTYLKASSQAKRHFTLQTNFRSEGGLLHALNTLFTNSEKPFHFDGIPFLPVSPPEKPRSGFVPLAAPGSPLEFRLLPDEDKPTTKQTAEEAISSAVVSDILGLMAEDARLGNRPLKFGDMAVLVRSKKQAADLQTLFRSHGIRSVLQTEQSIFATQEASDLQHLLAAVLEADRPGGLVAALATPFYGLSAAELLALESDDTVFRSYSDQMTLFRSEWESRGFMAFWSGFLIHCGARERLVRLPGGERRLTNILHLGELLHHAESTANLTPGALASWLQTQIAGGSPVADAAQLRLESDGDAVLLSTIHKSKGLEYPVVFCPFLWRPGDHQKRRDVLFHDPKEGNQLTLDLRGKTSPEIHQTLASDEIEAEAMRLLYVAVTRAKNRCYIYAGHIIDFDKSPLGRLVPGEGTPRGRFATLAETCPAFISVSVINPLESSRRPPPADLSPGHLKARPFSAVISNEAMTTSFSGLTTGRSEEESDRDAGDFVPEPLDSSAEFSRLAKFPVGIQSGIFFHAVLENFDFQKPETLECLVRNKLSTHFSPAIRDQWALAVCEQLQQVIRAELQPGCHLSEVSLTDRLNEVEFTFPLKLGGSDRLVELFAGCQCPTIVKAAADQLGRLHFRPVDGYMRGVIDLLFRSGHRYFVLDWKSNRLGDKLDDYRRESVQNCMLEDFYFLQYHLYTLAAHLFLKSRIRDYDYDAHFGGVYYLFLRGIDNARPAHGLFFDRPNLQFVLSMEAELIRHSPAQL